ncbi:hypothetical protein BDW72DRAFT_188342 [Aspergillus terricola var. indicus]
MEANQEFDFDPTLIGFDATLFEEGFDRFFPLPSFNKNNTGNHPTSLEVEISDLKTRVDNLERENSGLRS